MRSGTNGEQLMLFRNRVAWQELPREIRDQTIDLIITLCVEIVNERSPGIQEQDDESIQLSLYLTPAAKFGIC